jgi:hypothetical protein
MMVVVYSCVINVKMYISYKTNFINLENLIQKRKDKVAYLVNININNN